MQASILVQVQAGCHRYTGQQAKPDEQHPRLLYTTCPQLIAQSHFLLTGRRSSTIVAVRQTRDRENAARKTTEQADQQSTELLDKANAYVDDLKVIRGSHTLLQIEPLYPCAKTHSMIVNMSYVVAHLLLSINVLCAAKMGQDR